ncbi:hypothetical protein [Caldiplasma sukawensis]
MESIKIAGAGVSGRFLYNLLKKDGFDVTIYDPKVKNKYLPCGFATNKNKIIPYLKEAEMVFDDILVKEGEQVLIEAENFSATEFRSSGICTIDKMKMETIMVEHEKVIPEKLNSYNKDDLVIDASGISRALLGKYQGDFTMYAIEKITPESPWKDFYFYFFPSGRGYFWSFPMGDYYHIGAGGISLDEVKKILEKYGEKFMVSRKIRMRPTIEGICKKNVIGVGESIGYISPLLGEGIVPALENAHILYECIKNYSDMEKLKESYRKMVDKKMNLFNNISIMIEKMENGNLKKSEILKNATTALRFLKDFGISPRYMSIMRHFL